MTLDEKKKKRRKKQPYDSKTYTTGNPMLNDYFFNKIHGTLGTDTDSDEESSDLADNTSDVGNTDIGDSGLGESLLTEAMSYTTIKKLLDEIWANRSGVEGVIAKIDVTGNVGPDIAKWVETKVANLVHIDGNAEYDLNQIMADDDGDAYEAGEKKDTLNSKLKEAKTVVLISNFINADASTKKQLLKLFVRKNIQMIIMTGTEVELRRIPEDMKAKFKHEISFIEKDNANEPAKAAVTNNPVYNYAGAEPVNATESLTEAKREVRRYFIRPQNIFCANKAEIIKALIDIGDQNCSVYTLKYLGPEKDINKLTNKDIIYYYDDEILYDKNHVKVMDYDLYIKHEEERKKFTGDIEDVPEEKFNDEYEDRIHQDTVLEDTDIPLSLDFELTEDKQQYVCCICGEPQEGYGNNPDPYKQNGRCCDACNLKFVIPARLSQYRDEYSWPGLDDYFDEVND